MLRSQSVYGRRAVVAARESYACLLVHVTGSNAAGDRWQSLQKSRSSSKGCSRLISVVRCLSLSDCSRQEQWAELTHPVGQSWSWNRPFGATYALKLPECLKVVRKSCDCLFQCVLRRVAAQTSRRPWRSVPIVWTRRSVARRRHRFNGTVSLGTIRIRTTMQGSGQ